MTDFQAMDKAFDEAMKPCPHTHLDKTHNRAVCLDCQEDVTALVNARPPTLYEVTGQREPPHNCIVGYYQEYADLFMVEYGSIGRELHPSCYSAMNWFKYCPECGKELPHN